MNVTINIVELATELADFKINEILEYENVYEDEDEDETKYTDEAQKLFDYYYDSFYFMIEQTKVKP
jgi:hypothetical protein